MQFYNYNFKYPKYPGDLNFLINIIKLHIKFIAYKIYLHTRPACIYI